MRRIFAVGILALASCGGDGSDDSAVASAFLARFVAFHSDATNLVAGDTNGGLDAFVLDRSTGAVTRVSVATGGAQATGGGSADPSLSSDGRIVAFGSDATNLVAGDTNAVSDIFVHDRDTGTTTRVSVATGGAQATGASVRPSISSDGRFVAFDSVAADLIAGDTNAASDVFVHDRQTGATTRVSVATGGAQATGASFVPAISSDGRFVAFDSVATDLVAGDTNALRDVFVHDRQTGATTRVSVATGGGQSAGGDSVSAAITPDGRFVAIQSAATNLVAGDTNGAFDIFVHDRQTGETTRASIATGGAQSNADSGGASMSSDGRFVSWQSPASTLVTGDTNGTSDIFVHDRQTATTTRASVATGGAQATGISASPSLSPDGRLVAFHSTAADLVTGDTNGQDDVFLHDRDTGTTTRISVSTAGAQGDGPSREANISGP